MLLRKDALMKVDKRWKNMSARPDVVLALGGGDGHRAGESVCSATRSGDDTAVARDTAAGCYCLLASLIHPHALVTIVHGEGCGRGRIHQTPFVLMKLPTMVHAR